VETFNLRAFCLVVDHGSVSAAAHELTMSQSAVSMLLRRLETHYRVKLVWRHGGGVAPTHAGMSLYRYAKEVLQAEDRLDEELEPERESGRGWVRVGATRTIAAHFLPPILARHQEAWPDARVVIATATSEGMCDLLMTGRVDFACCAFQDSKELVNIPIYRERLIIVSAPDDDLANRASVSPQDILRKPFILSVSASPLRQRLETALGCTSRTPLRVALQVADTEAIKQAVQCGLGCALILRSAVERELQQGQLREITVEGVSLAEEFFLVRRKGSSLPTAAAALYTTILKAADEIGLPSTNSRLFSDLATKS
jgi:LysR family transcriptional regulator, transcriptional activator of the cysJI operon